jgi:chitin synthase
VLRSHSSFFRVIGGCFVFPLHAAMESVFGYVSVLPGAFSAYRWEAIKGEPLRSYFFIETHSMVETGPLMANMYLAEDRVCARCL